MSNAVLIGRILYADPLGGVHRFVPTSLCRPAWWCSPICANKLMPTRLVVFTDLCQQAYADPLGGVHRFVPTSLCRPAWWCSPICANKLMPTRLVVFTDLCQQADETLSLGNSNHVLPCFYLLYSDLATHWDPVLVTAHDFLTIIHF